SPEVVVFKGPAGVQTAQLAAPVPRDREENPLEVVSREREQALVTSIPRRHENALFIGLGIGAGYGWHPARKLDFRDAIEASPSTGAAGTAFVTPELGYQWTDKLAFSVQGRYEFINSSGLGDPHQGTPATDAWAIMARGYYNVLDRRRL